MARRITVRGELKRVSTCVDVVEVDDADCTAKTRLERGAGGVEPR
jgi:hypothetical protein